MKILLPALKEHRGFTLIELIVVFSVIAILSTIGVASFVSYSRSQTLQQAANDLVNVLNTAKARSISQIKPDVLQCNNGTLDGYKVMINDPSVDKYTLYAVCSGSSVNAVTTPLPPNVSFNSATGTPPTTTTSIFFSVLTGGVTRAGNVVLSYPSVSSILPKTVTVTPAGGIQ